MEESQTHKGPGSDQVMATYQVSHWLLIGGGKACSDVMSHCVSCPQCAVVNAAGRVNRHLLHPIPVSQPFEIIGVDIMDLLPTKSGNQHVVVSQDFLTKSPLVYPVTDHKALRLTRLLAEEVVPMFGVPEYLLLDRGTNLLSHLMTDLCKLLGIKKLNMTAYCRVLTTSNINIT